MNKHVLVLATIILLTLPLIYPFIQRGYFPTHDGEWAVVRLAEMNREIKDGQIPPRWAGYLNHGFGYPLFQFTYPFPYYLAEIFHIFGFGLVDSVKAVFIVSVIGSAIGMFLLSQSIWSLWGALISTTLYLYVPYRLVNLFIRGSIGESLAFVFFPFLFWLIVKLSQKPGFQLSLVLSIVYAMFILTHNIMVVLFTPMFFIWVFYWGLYSKYKKYYFISFALAIMLALLLSSYFWLPAILEKKFIALSVTPLAQKTNHFVTLKQIFSTEWKYDIVPPLQIGWVHLLAGVISFLSVFITIKKNSKAILNLFFMLLILLAVAIFMIFSVSLPIWNLPLLKEIDFPWRNLGIIAFLLSLMVGSISKIKIKGLVGIVLVVLTVIAYSPYIKPAQHTDLPDDYYSTNDATTTSADELMPVWVKEKPVNRSSFPAVFDTGFAADIIQNKSQYWEVNVPSGNSYDKLILNQLYFPGWRAYFENQRVPIEVNELTGNMALKLGESGKINLKYEKTTVRWVSDIMTLVGIMLVPTLWIFSKKFSHTS